MRHLPIVPRFGMVTLLIATVGLLPSAAAQEERETKAFGIPASIHHEHEEIEAALGRATQEQGRVGAAARELAKVLGPHFARENQIALPPLGVLAPLARGGFAAEMRGVLVMTDSLRAEMPRMLEEHRAIRAATHRLQAEARAAGNVAVVQLTEKLKLHAQNEEEVMYPAAILIGDLVRQHTMQCPGGCGHSGQCPHGAMGHGPMRP